MPETEVEVTDPNILARVSEMMGSSEREEEVTDPAILERVRRRMTETEEEVTDPDILAKVNERRLAGTREPQKDANRLTPETAPTAAPKQPSQDIPDIFSTKTPAARTEILNSIKAAGFYPSFTAASNVATDRFLEKRNGKWVTPTLSRAADKDAGFGETVGAGLAGVGASIASMFGSQNEDLSPTLERIQKQYGLSDREMGAAWRDLIRQHSSWDKSEGDTRVLSDGTLMVNPESKAALDPEKMAELVNASPTTRANKERFMANYSTFQNNVASNKLEAYEAAASASQTLEAVPNVNAALKATGGGVPSPSQWGEQTGRMGEFGTPQFVAAYEKEVLEKEGKAGAYVRSIALDGLLGWNKVATTTLGILGYAGLDSAGQMAEESGQAGSVIGAGKTDTGIVGAAVQEGPSVLAQVVASQITGGASLALTGSARAAQAVGVISSIATAGAQSAGQTYYDSRAQGLSHEDSQRQATIAGTNTALVTGIFQAVPGFGGVEDIAAGKGMAGVTVGDILRAGSKQELWQGARTMAKDLAKAYVGEASEEAIDQITQTFLSADPETNLADAWKQAWEAGKVGGFMGAGTHVAANITRTPDQALLTPEVSELAPAAAEAARNTAVEGSPETETPPTYEGQTDTTTQAETEGQIGAQEARPPLSVQGMPEETVIPETLTPASEAAVTETISPQPTDSLPAGQTAVPTEGAAVPTQPVLGVAPTVGEGETAKSIGEARLKQLTPGVYEINSRGKTGRMTIEFKDGNPVATVKWADGKGGVLNPENFATREVETMTLEGGQGQPELVEGIEIRKMVEDRSAQQKEADEWLQGAPTSTLTTTPQTDATPTGNAPTDNQPQYQPTGQGGQAPETGGRNIPVESGQEAETVGGAEVTPKVVSALQDRTPVRASTVSEADQKALTDAGYTLIGDFYTPPVETISRDDLKSAFNLTDEQADAAEAMGRALGLTAENVLLRQGVKRAAQKKATGDQSPTTNDKTDETRLSIADGSIPNGSTVEPRQEGLTENDASTTPATGNAVEPPTNPRDTTYEKLLSKGKPVGPNMVELTDAQVPLTVRRKLYSDRDTQRGIAGRPEETPSFYLRPKGDVTGVTTDRGWILKDKRPDYIARQTPAAPTSPLTPDAQTLLDSGKTPRSVTKNLERIAKENGIVVNDTTKPAAIMAALRAKQQTKPTDETPEQRKTLLSNAVGRELGRQAVERGLITPSELETELAGLLDSGQLVEGAPTQEREGLDERVDTRKSSVDSVVDGNALTTLAERLGYDPQVLSSAITEIAANRTGEQEGVRLVLERVARTDGGDGRALRPVDGVLRDGGTTERLQSAPEDTDQKFQAYLNDIRKYENPEWDTFTEKQRNEDLRKLTDNLLRDSGFRVTSDPQIWQGDIGGQPILLDTERTLSERSVTRQSELGGVTIRLGSSAVSPSGSADQLASKAQLAMELNEELIHAAHLLSLESRSPDGDAFAEAARVFDRIIEQDIPAAESNRLARAIAASISAYTGFRFTDETLQAATLADFKSLLPDEKARHLAELVRQTVQLRSKGEITETTFERVRSAIREWLQSSRDLLRNLASRPQQLGNAFSEEIRMVEEMLGSERFQAPNTDAAYLAAVEAGDMETAQRMVDEAAREAGYTVEGWHGTPEKNRGFTEFDTASDKGNWLGDGAYFSNDERTASQYQRDVKGFLGEGAKQFLLALKNPYKWKGPTLGEVYYDGVEFNKLPLEVQKILGSRSDTPTIQEASTKITEGLRALGYDGVEGPDTTGVNEDFTFTLPEGQTLEGFLRERDPNAEITTRSSEGKSTITVTNEAGRMRLLVPDGQRTFSVPGEFLGNTEGLDQIKIYERVVFDPNQIKSADPVTRDADGNVIPLSERFNLDSPDIRFQKRPQGAKGSAQLTPDGKALLTGFQSADFTTAAHEMMHGFEMTGYGDLTDSEVKTLKNWAGSRTEGRTMMETPASEKLARGWERYLANGKAPIRSLQPLFDKIAKWMLDVYGSVKNAEIDVDISPAVMEIFDKLAARMAAPPIVTMPSGVIMETTDGSPVPDAIEPTKENAEKLSTPDEAAGYFRGVLEKPLPNPETDGKPQDLEDPYWNPEGLFSMQKRSSYEQSATYKLDTSAWVKAANTFKDMWEVAINRPAGYGELLIQKIIADNNPDRAWTAQEIADLTHEGLRRKVAVDEAQTAVAQALTADNQEAVKIAMADQLTALAKYQAIHDLAASARTSAGRALNAWKYALRADYSVAVLQSRLQADLSALRKGNKLPDAKLTREVQTRIEEHSQEQLARQAELDQRRAMAESELADANEKLDRANALIAELQAERKAAGKKTKIQDFTKKLVVDKVRKAAAEARARLNIPEDPTLRFQAATPDNDPRWTDRILVMAEYLVAEPTMSAARFADLVRLKFGDAFHKVADKLRKDTQDHLRDTREDITGVHVPTPEEIMETVSADEELTREVVYALAKAHVYDGAREFDVMRKVHADLATVYEDLTHAEVTQLFTQYGDQTKLNPNEEAKALRAAKALELVQKQIDDLETRGQILKTGRQKDADDLKLRELRKTRDDLAKQIGYVPTDPATGMSSAQTAARKRMENEIEELQQATESGTPRVRVRRGVEYTEDMKTLREKLEALRAHYEDTFGKERTPAEIEARLIKDLDRRIAKEESLIERVLLAEPSSPVSSTAESPEVIARRERLSSLREQKREAYERAHPGETALKQATEAAEKALARRQAILEAGVPVSAGKKPRYSPTEALTALWESVDALDAQIREIRKARPLTPERQQAQLDAAYDSAVRTREELSRRIAEGDLAATPAPTRNQDARLRAIREENAALRKQIIQMRKDAGVGPFSSAVKEARREASLEKRIAEFKRKRAEQDFTKKARPTTASNERIRQLELEMDEADRKFNEDNAKFLFTQLGWKGRTLERGVALWMARQTINLTGDFGIFGRQFGKVQYRIITKDILAVAKRVLKGEKADIKDGTVVGKMLSAGYQTLLDPSRVEEIYRDMATDARYAARKQRGFRLISPHEVSHELSADGKVRLNPLSVLSNRMVAVAMLSKGLVKTAVAAGATFYSPWTAVITWPLAVKGILQTLGSIPLAMGGVAVAKRIEAAQTAMTNIGRWGMLDYVDIAAQNVEPSAQEDFLRIATEADMIMSGKIAGTGGFTKWVKDNTYNLGLIFRFVQYNYTNAQTMAMVPLMKAAFSGQARWNSKARWQTIGYVASGYGYWVVGAAAQRILVAALMGVADDDDEEVTMGVVSDPKHPNFGQVRVGRTYINFDGGAMKWWTDAVKIFSDEKIDSALLDDHFVGYEEKSSYDRKEAVKNWWYSKINMNIATMAEFGPIREFYEGGDLSKQDPLRQADLLLNETVMNLTIQQNFEIFEEHGPLEGAKLSLLLQFGRDVNIRETGREREDRKIAEKENYLPEYQNE